PTGTARAWRTTGSRGTTPTAMTRPWPVAWSEAGAWLFAKHRARRDSRAHPGGTAWAVPSCIKARRPDPLGVPSPRTRKQRLVLTLPGRDPTIELPDERREVAGSRSRRHQHDRDTWGNGRVSQKTSETP